MNIEEMAALFDGDGEFLKFDRIVSKLSQRPDLHAFLLLDSLCPGTRDMVSGAEHDEIYLEVNLVELAERATAEQIIDLHRCGVRYSEENGCLCMFA